MNQKQEQKLCKITTIMFVVDTPWEKYILFLCLDFLVFSVYLNANKNKDFLKYKFCGLGELIHAKLLKF